uniref:Calcineurin-like phosphoesterase domain-containing protein n=1 Tax=Meloidogyne floridensis TaxID=298350 RepID=A0A915NXJ0_9BILA
MAFENGIIRADPMSHRPVELWKKYLRQVRFVCISDTHEKMDEILDLIPDGDVLIHAGDFTEAGDVSAVIKFNQQIGKLPHKVYGIKIYGAPWHPMPGYSFYRQRGQALLQKWNQIPNKTDVLITHTPPLGHGDFNAWTKLGGMLAGCAELLNTVEYRVKPKYHVFGHIHQQHGCTTNGVTTFINASTCDHKLRTEYDPIIFDMPLPYGRSKDEVIVL